PPCSSLLPYTTLFRSGVLIRRRDGTEAVSVWNGVNPTEPQALRIKDAQGNDLLTEDVKAGGLYRPWIPLPDLADDRIATWPTTRSEEHTSELQSRENL